MRKYLILLCMVALMSSTASAGWFGKTEEHGGESLLTTENWIVYIGMLIADSDGTMDSTRYYGNSTSGGSFTASQAVFQYIGGALTFRDSTAYYSLADDGWGWYQAPLVLNYSFSSGDTFFVAVRTSEDGTYESQVWYLAGDDDSDSTYHENYNWGQAWETTPSMGASAYREAGAEIYYTTASGATAVMTVQGTAVIKSTVQVGD